MVDNMINRGTIEFSPENQNVERRKMEGVITFTEKNIYVGLGGEAIKYFNNNDKDLEDIENLKKLAQEELKKLQEQIAANTNLINNVSLQANKVSQLEVTDKDLEAKINAFNSQLLEKTTTINVMSKELNDKILALQTEMQTQSSSKIEELKKDINSQLSTLEPKEDTSLKDLINKNTTDIATDKEKIEANLRSIEELRNSVKDFKTQVDGYNQNLEQVKQDLSQDKSGSEEIKQLTEDLAKFKAQLDSANEKMTALDKLPDMTGVAKLNEAQTFSAKQIFTQAQVLAEAKENADAVNLLTMKNHLNDKVDKSDLNVRLAELKDIAAPKVDLTNLLKYKNTVQSKTNLPLINNLVGDTYYVIDDNAWYVYIDNAFKQIGSQNVDLSNVIDLTTTQTITGQKTFNNIKTSKDATADDDVTNLATVKKFTDSVIKKTPTGQIFWTKEEFTNLKDKDPKGIYLTKENVQTNSPTDTKVKEFMLKEFPIIETDSGSKVWTAEELPKADLRQAGFYFVI